MPVIKLANLSINEEKSVDDYKHQFRILDKTLGEMYILVEINLTRLSTTDVLCIGQSDNHLLNAALYAYNTHGGLQLSPDVILQCVANAISVCVKDHAEEYRDVFVQHAGKIKLTVEGKYGFDWTELLAKMETEINENIQCKFDIMPAFSTTTDVIRSVATMTKMSTLANYFNYEMHCMCGINFVDLTGTLEDWEKLYYQVQQLSAIITKKQHMVDWFGHILEIIKRLIRTYITGSTRTNNADYEKLGKFAKVNLGEDLGIFWSRIITYIPYGSGGQRYVSGWLKVLMPGEHYDSFPKKLNLLDPYEETPECSNNIYKYQDDLKEWAGLTFKEPVSTATIEVNLNHNGDLYEVFGTSGIVGFKIEEKEGMCYAVPEIGYAVYAIPTTEEAYIAKLLAGVKPETGVKPVEKSKYLPETDSDDDADKYSATVQVIKKLEEENAKIQNKLKQAEQENTKLQNKLKQGEEENKNLHYTIKSLKTTVIEQMEFIERNQIDTAESQVAYVEDDKKTCIVS